ncbi:MAG: THUMP domain-containing protein [Bacteroidales bacterium]|nr:THUMP domain-containing protein [Bacteroidales bacterium]MDY4927195.1 THUMP domain-containing protein [Prevotella sp.]
MEYEMIAKTFMGLEPVLAKELVGLGASNVQIGRRMVSFTGDKEMMYRANFHLHTAIRILKPIKRFRASSADDVYEGVKSIDWSDYLDERQTFSVDSVVYSEDFRNSRFVTYRVKDAIVDQFIERGARRPNISVANPDLRLNIHISENSCTLSLDSSGESLHRRGYRQESVDAPLNEVLAAGMILMTGWKGDTDFIDPMCGSGTILIEAALIAQNMAPGVFRKEYAFERWHDFDRELLDEIYNDDSKEREFTHKIYGYDIDIKAVNTARINVRAAGLTKCIEVECADFKDFTQPSGPAIMVCNPPYGERISTPNLLNTYRMIGDRLKHQFQGNEAWILSYRQECFEAIGLKPSLKIPLYNGSLECEFRKYAVFAGRLADFREKGGIVKTEEELKQMAEKHRFKQHREFKERLDADKEEQQPYFGVDDNDEDDIRTFRFRSLERRSSSEAAKRGGRERHRFSNHDSGLNDPRDNRRGYERKPYGKNERRAFDRDRAERRGYASDRRDSDRRGNLSDRRRMFGDDDG